MRKALFSSDFVAALAIFMVALLIVGPMWSSINMQVQGIEGTKAMQAAALDASEMLVRTRGSPENWNTTSVRSIGLADELRVLNATKGKYFFQYLASNYSDAKFMLGAGAYEFTAQITNRNNDVVYFGGVNFTYGQVDYAIAQEVVNTERLAIMKYNESAEEFVKLRVSIWR